MSAKPDDVRWMQATLALARRGLGLTAPNPNVGCILVKDDKVVGRGWTQPGGRPHAEAMAIAQAGEAAHGACAYVSLEPCAHHGQTAPCADALISAGVSRVVAAIKDPDPRVAGAGLKRISDAGIPVRVGLCSDEARMVNVGFLSRLIRGRPFVTAKLATTLDGKVATRAGQSKWITGASARAHGHYQRALHDAILIGAGTARADRPALTCRLPGLLNQSPQPFVVKGTGALPLETSQITVISAAEDEEWPSPQSILSQLAAKGMGRVLIEGGPALVTSFLRSALIDQILWYRAPNLFGSEGYSAITALDVDEIVAAPSFKLAESCQLGQDRVDVYMKRKIEQELTV